MGAASKAIWRASSRGGAMDKSHIGTCFCGAVTVEVTGAPLEMGYCHCSSCRLYSGAPVSAYVLWKQDDVKITKGADLVGRYKKTEMSDRHFCKTCGGHVLVSLILYFPSPILNQQSVSYVAVE
jgi:hypothetical protein